MIIMNWPLSCDASFSFSSSVDMAEEEHDQVNKIQFLASIWKLKQNSPHWSTWSVSEAPDDSEQVFRQIQNLNNTRVTTFNIALCV